MSGKHAIVRGTLILTITGFISRFMGFFYRIFLSRTFGEEGVGLYQLIFPVYTLCFSITTAGIETAISRTVAQKISCRKKREAMEILISGLLITVSLSVLCMVFVQKEASWIARVFLGDSRCTPLLFYLSYTFPFSAIHSCITGYCYGRKAAKIPAAAQLTEQTARMLCVCALFILLNERGIKVPIAIAVWGLVIGEAASAVFTVYILLRQNFSSCFHVKHFSENPDSISHTNKGFFSFLTVLKKRSKELLSFSVPLTMNRILITLLQSIEAVSIPGQLVKYGYSQAQALGMYGVLNGMALPCILFPSAITSSISIMLMPAVAEIQVSSQQKDLGKIIKRSCLSCFILGLGCCLLFLISGSWLGQTVFHSNTAGKQILTLAWICPFLYTNSALLSIINGLGKTNFTLFINMSGLIIRICGVFFAIPIYGIRGYLWGLLLSQLAVSLFSIIGIKIFTKPSVHA